MERVGQQMGNYRLIRLIGKGGFAEVYLGEHIYLETQVAIKILSTKLTGEDVENFLTEARTIARLAHPHIIRILEAGIEQDTPYFAMTYAAQGTLRDYYPRGTLLPLPDIISYVNQIAEALQYAHDQNFIHRDVKPANMLLVTKNEVLLSDFGITISAHNTATFTSQPIIGTPSYMAPEQLSGQPRKASDQYSLAVVAYEWLCGIAPYPGSIQEIVMGHISTPPPSIREHIPTIPSQIEQVVLKALAKDPRERYPSIAEFANALEKAASRVSVEWWHTAVQTPAVSNENGIPPTITIAGTDMTSPDAQNATRSAQIGTTPAWQNPQDQQAGQTYYPTYPLYPPYPPKSPFFKRLGRWARALSADTATAFEQLGRGAQNISHEALPLAEQLGERIQNIFHSPVEDSALPPIDHTYAPPERFNAATALFPSSILPADAQLDFFISYSRADLPWAKWIKKQLEDHGHATLLPPWGVRPGMDFALEVQKGAAKAKRLIVVMSPLYLNTLTTQPRWISLFKQYASHEQSLLLPICVQTGGRKFSKLLESIHYIDIATEDEATASAMLLAGIRGEGVELTIQANFPGMTIMQTKDTPVPFPKMLFSTLRIPANLVTKAMNTPVTHPSSPAQSDTTLKQQIETAFSKKDWPDVLRKVDLLSRQSPQSISDEIFFMQGQAFLEEGDVQQAYEALRMALALTNEHSQRLTLLESCTTILIVQGHWQDALKYTQEALRLSPNDPTWLAYQQEIVEQLEQNKLSSGTTQTPPHPAPRPPVSKPPGKKIEIFFSYSHKDKEIRDELEKFLSSLRREKSIIWHDGEIGAGAEWAEEIDKHLSQAHIILLLVSQDFIASEYCYDIEMIRALERHKNGEARVIPIIIRPSLWNNTPFSRLQVLPTGGRPVTQWSNRDEALVDVANGIEKAANTLLKIT